VSWNGQSEERAENDLCGPEAWSVLKMEEKPAPRSGQILEERRLQAFVISTPGSEKSAGIFIPAFSPHFHTGAKAPKNCQSERRSLTIVNCK
jgi:hypothetical protein